MALTEHFKSLFWWVPLGRVPEISAADLHRALTGDNPPQIFDVRTSAEWRLSHIAGSRNLSLKQLKRDMKSLCQDDQQPIVAICLSAHRSIPAVRLLLAKGYPNTVQLQGGMLAWWKQDLPTEHAD